jgi:hypothetical protein
VQCGRTNARAITATTTYDIMTLQENTPRANVLNKVMKYSEKDLSNVAAVKFGQQFEKYAKLAYEDFLLTFLIWVDILQRQMWSKASEGWIAFERKQK